MKKRMEKVTKEKASSGVEEKPPKTSGLDIQDICTVQTIEDYQCSGNLEVDFPTLCALAGMRVIPAVRLQTTAATSTDEAIEEAQDSGSHLTTWSPCLQIELENEDSRSVKRVRISGWTVDELMTRVLSGLLPSLSNLQSLEMWQAGVTDLILTSLKNTVALCSNLRKVVLEGNPITKQSYHILMREDSMITHLSLRNNRIGEEGARLIGAALSSNKNLVCLNMAFNCIGDAGAMHIAQGLRFNRTILCLSLANNQIGDTGASCLAEVLCPFALTHEEIVERRRLLIRIHQLPAQKVREDSKCEQPLSIHSSSSLEQINKGPKYGIKKKDSSRKEDKPVASQKVATAGKKEDNNKLVKKTSDSKLSRAQGGKSEMKDKQLSVIEKESGEVVETQNPLLDPSIQHVYGKIIYPGNTTLTSLNLSGNKLTPKSLEMFLSSLRGQGEAGLLRLSLDRNNCPAECDVFLKIHEMMSIKDPLIKTQMEDD